MPWFIHDGFHYKNMMFENSSFPNCLHMVLANFGACPRDDIIEKRWNKLQVICRRSSTADRSPNEDDVIFHLRRTDMNGAEYRIITSTMLEDDVSRQVLEQEAQHYLADYSAMIIGIGHAELFYRVDTGFVHVDPSPDIRKMSFRHYSNLNIEIVGKPGRRVFLVTTMEFGMPSTIITGTCMTLLRP